MIITDAVYIAEDVISMQVDGQYVSFRVDPDNRYWIALQQSGVTIVSFTSPPPTADDIRAECQRRMIALVGARDASHLDVIISNALREGLRYSNTLLAGNSLTTDEAARRTVLMETDRRIEDLRRCSNALELICPDDYTADRHWSLT